MADNDLIRRGDAIKTMQDYMENAMQKFPQHRYRIFEMKLDLYAMLCTVPQVYAGEVLRCRDCKHWGATLSEAERKKAASNPCSDLVCDMWMSDGFTPGDYCSQGERRNDDV